MSDTTAVEATEAETEPTATEPQVEQQGDPADEPLGEGGKKALQAERDRAKELEKKLNEVTSKLTEIERANESDLEKAQREAREAAEAAATATTQAFREAAVIFGGISADDADLFLTASDKETLQKQAARLVERTPPTSPLPDLSQGGKGGPLALNSDGLEDALRSKLGI